MHAIVTHAAYLELVAGMADLGQNLLLQLLGLGTGRKLLARMVSLTVIQVVLLISKLK